VGTEQCLGVPAEAEGAVHSNRAGLLESRREKFHHPLQHDRYVRWGGAAAVLWCALRRVACH